MSVNEDLEFYKETNLQKTYKCIFPIGKEKFISDISSSEAIHLDTSKRV